MYYDRLNQQTDHFGRLIQPPLPQQHYQQPSYQSSFFQHRETAPPPQPSLISVHNVQSKTEAESFQVPEGTIVLLCQADGKAVYVKRTVRDGIGLATQIEEYIKEVKEEPVFQMPDLSSLTDNTEDLKELKEEMQQIRQILEGIVNDSKHTKAGNAANEAVRKSGKQNTSTK